MSPARFKGKELKEGEQITISVDFSNGTVEPTQPIQEDTQEIPPKEIVSEPVKEIPTQEPQQSYLDISHFVQQDSSTPNPEPQSISAEQPQPQQQPVQPEIPSLPEQPQEYKEIPGLIPTDQGAEIYQKSEAEKERQQIEQHGQMTYDPPKLNSIATEPVMTPVESVSYEVPGEPIYRPEINEDQIQEEVTPQIPSVITDKNSPSSKLVMGCLILLFASFVILLVVAMIMILQLL